MDAPERPTLRGARVVLRPARATDLPRLLEILHEPAVAARWGSLDDVDGLLLGEDADASEAITTFVIALAGEAVGWLAAWEKLVPEYRHAGIDLFLTTSEHAKGYGPEAIHLACRWLFDERKHHRITIDPAASNERAIRAYEKVGFKRVGVMRKYERAADGSFHDGVLMDLLPEDLQSRPRPLEAMQLGQQ